MCVIQMFVVLSAGRTTKGLIAKALLHSECDLSRTCGSSHDAVTISSSTTDVKVGNSSPPTLHISHNHHSKVTRVERQMEKCDLFNRRWRSAPSAGLIPALDDLIKLQANFTIGRCRKEILIIPLLQASHYHKDSDIVLRPTCSPASSHGNYHCWIRGPSRQVDVYSTNIPNI